LVPQPEQEAREGIEQLLIQADWSVCDVARAYVVLQGLATHSGGSEFGDNSIYDHECDATTAPSLR